jgi:hypothetical protein
VDKSDILKAIKWEIDYCETTSIKINPAFARTQMSVIDLIEKYNLSQYRDGDYDQFGNPRPFYNIVNYAVDVAAKMIDMDVKDIQILSEDENYWSSFVMQKELHYWMKEMYFGDFLNQLAYNLPKYGHVVVKKVEDRVHIVPLTSLRFRPDAWSLKNIPIVERHTYQPDEFLLEAKKKGWENVDLVSLQPAQTVDNGVVYSNPKISVFEAEFPKGFLDSEYNYFVMTGDGVLLAYDYHKTSIYKDLAWEKIRGRTLGRGQIEKLFHEQIYINRSVAEETDGLAWTSKHLFQTRDNSVARNLLSQVENGDVLIVNDDVKPVQTEERNLAFYQYNSQKWEANAYKKTFTQDMTLMGKSKTQNKNAAMIAQELQSGYFKQKKDEMGNFIKQILWDWIMPEFKDDKKGEHKVLMRNIISGDDGSEKLFGMVVGQRLEEKKLEMLLNGKLVMGNEEKILKSTIGEEVKHENITIPKGLYEDLKYKVDIITGDETIDTHGKVQSIEMVLQIIGSNPTILQNPQTKSLFYKMLNYMGFNPKDIAADPVLSLQDSMSQINPPQLGGSVARPKTPQPAQMVTAQQTQ